jgi:hypothetical protein
MPETTVMVSLEFLRNAIFGSLQVDIHDIQLGEGREVLIGVHGLDVPDDCAMAKVNKVQSIDTWLEPVADGVVPAARKVGDVLKFGDY